MQRSLTAHFHQGPSPWANTRPASAVSALKELAAKLLSPSDRKKAQAVEDRLGKLDTQLAKHCDAESFKQAIWDLMNASEEDQLDTESRVEACKKLQAQIADIPEFRSHIDKDFQREIRALVPYARRLLVALSERIDTEVVDILENGVGGRNSFWGIDSIDTNHYTFPLLRLGDFTASHIAMLDKYSPENGFLVRQTLIDSGAIKQRAKLIRG